MKIISTSTYQIISKRLNNMLKLYSESESLKNIRMCCVLPFLVREPTLQDFSIHNYFKYFFSIYNPVFLALLLFLLLFVVIYISYKHIYYPLLKKHKREKESLELKNVKLLTLFTELDPNPIIKVNPSGIIVGMNRSAKEKLNGIELDNDIQRVLGEYDFSFGELIKNDNSVLIIRVYQSKFYEINIHGISLLEMAQLYLYDVTEKREQVEQMNTYQRLLKDSSANSLRDLEDERSRIAALLHDSIGQNLLLIKLGIQNLKKHLNGNHNCEEYINAINILDSTIKETKEISRRIRPLNLDELGLNTVLASLCKTVSNESHLRYQLNLPDEKIILNKDLELCIYRVVQEALNNIIIHSEATSFAVNLNLDDGTVTLGISDDGRGFVPSILLSDKYISNGLGIMNMQERVERLNGTFHIDSSINKGTTIIAYFPLEKANEEFQ